MMGHIPHLVDFLFHEHKVGGWIAVACAVAAFYWASRTSPFMVDSPFGCTPIGGCPQVFEAETFVEDVTFAVFGGLGGVGLAMLLAYLGVSKDKLGIDE